MTNCWREVKGICIRVLAVESGTFCLGEVFRRGGGWGEKPEKKRESRARIADEQLVSRV